MNACSKHTVWPRSSSSEIGDLVLVGPSGWGGVPTGDATVLGTVPRAILNGLYRDAAVVAYVPRAEGWGLPPVEALHAGARVVASVTTPSVEGNSEVVRVDPLDVQAIAQGLLTALASGDDDASRLRRQASVADLTWRNVALDHLGGVAVRVALDVSAVPPQLAGAGRYIAELARRLPTNDVDTTLVTRRDDTLRWHDWSPASYVASVVPNARASRLLYEAWLLGTSSTARSADVWHAPHYTMPRRRSRPTVVTIHDLTFFTNPEWHERAKVPFFRRAITYAATHADVLISVSDFTSRQLEEILPRHAPLVTAPLGVDLERFSLDAGHDGEVLRAHHLPADRPYIFFLGTFEPRKGLDVLLTAFEEIARRRPEVELWLAGQAGWGVKAIETQIAEHGANDRIRRLDYVDDLILPSLLRQAATVAYPSRGEGFGLPVLEALACGAMVVTTDDTVMSDVAAGTALLANAGDSTSLAAQLENALSMTEPQRRERASLGRARAEQFSWGSSIAQHVVAYNMAAGLA